MKEGDLILCTVEKVTNTITIVRLPDNKEGTIISSEIAPGRIKHMREYVIPNKKIVCKVLELSGNNIQLSLRRVNSKEKKEVLEKFKGEQATNVAFRQILGPQENVIKEKILKTFSTLHQFLEDAKKDEKILKIYIPKEKFEAIKKIIEKKRKTAELKHLVKLKCLESDGIKKIKEIFDIKDKNLEVTYLAAGNFRLKLTVDDFKQGKKRLSEILQEIEEKAKKINCEFFEKEEK